MVHFLSVYYSLLNLFLKLLPDKSELSIRFRSASTQNSFPNLLSTTRATGLIRPVVKRTSRSVPSKAARSIFGDLSCMFVKYMYLKVQKHASLTSFNRSCNFFKRKSELLHNYSLKRYRCFK